MNDEASSSAPDEPPRSDAPASDEADVVDDAQQLSQLRRRVNKKRGDVLDDVLRWLDIMTHAELAAVYYME